ncbi:hypothetical protein GOP47_0019966 [Adiantum capillus-veneris]|uniref:O-fucosyltransferase family protein n=1 Tax=Adiantum capillus-veneris TaxID=13818 RepID=A0A9D4UC33_ADICA|nr:hypothetical protein GOP47_0019966 [Adiantum capillus-veneris]
MPSVQIPPSNAIQAFLVSSPKRAHSQKLHGSRLFSRPSFWLGLMAICLSLSLIKLILTWRPLADDLPPCGPEISLSHLARSFSSANHGSNSKLISTDFAGNGKSIDSAISADTAPNDEHPSGRTGFVAPFPLHALEKNMSESERQFWRQPDSQGFKPCLSFTTSYREEFRKISQDKRKYLIVIVSGGLNQQRNQIVDAVVIARILGATLVVPILQINQIWQDDSEFSDIFDVDHFKKSLKDDVLVVSSLPSTHVMTRPVQERSTPLYATPQWFRRHYLKRLNREGVLLLRGMDGRLSKDLPQDLQKLKCKVAFQALRFTSPIMELGNKLARRMWEGGPYVALHLRLEKDVWVRTGCLPGLGAGFDDEVRHARIDNPQLLTGRSNMTYTERKLAGLCPLNAAEVARLLKGLGAPRSTRIFWAGGKPLGGDLALKPLINEFGHLYNKEKLALPGELEPFANKASSLAAIDYAISLHSDVFMPSHGGNMAKSLQGHRAYAGYRKHITPNKREMLPYFFDMSSFPEADIDMIIKQLHNDSLGQPVFRTEKRGRDVLAYPAPDCMCNGSAVTHHNPSTASL